MAISLQTQPIYYSRENVIKPISLTVFFVVLLILALMLQIWIHIKLVDIGYDLASHKKRNEYLTATKNELELQKTILLRGDYLLNYAQVNLAMEPIKSEQAIKILN